MKIKNINNNKLVNICGGIICKCFMEDGHITKKVKMINMPYSNEEACMKKCCSEIGYLEYSFDSERIKICPLEERMAKRLAVREFIIPVIEEAFFLFV